MATEIERKFIVDAHAFKAEKHTAKLFKQGYLNSNKERTVRVRIEGDLAFLTIKSMTEGIRRQEFEYSIPCSEAEALLKLCETPAIEKLRYKIQYEKHRWDVDVFLAANRGLVIAEIELTDEAEYFARPSWLGEEVSGDARYYNSQLSLSPFSSWPNP